MPRPVSPPIAADVIAEIGTQIVLIERKNFPFGWAIPGGFVDFGETVEATETKALAPVIVTFSMDYTSGAEYWIGLDVNGHGCNFYGSRESPAVSIFLPAAYTWVIESGDGVLKTGTNTFELCGGGAPGYSSGTLLMGYNTLAARTGN